MPMIHADDGVRLYAEKTGSGTPMLFIHEFAGDHRSWEPQVQHFSAALECITYSARGYPPSDVPADPSAYSQQRAVDDAICLEPALMLKRAIPGSGLSVLPQTGHTANLEDPDAFNREVDASWRRSTSAPGGAAIRAPCPPPPPA